MKNFGQIAEKIQAIAKDVFESSHIEDFISKVQSLQTDEPPIDFILQVSTDEGNELELGFFTNSKIADITLSKGKVYFYVYPISTIQKVGITEADSKWTLTIVGEKKFDYNVVKPADNTSLSTYENSLNAYLSSRKCETTSSIP